MADQAAEAVRDRGATGLTLVVVSGAPGTGKSTIARELGSALRRCVLSLDPIKEALAAAVTPLGLGGPLVQIRRGDLRAAAARSDQRKLCTR